MSDASIAIHKLQHIEELWEKLKGFKTHTPEYTTLIKQIGVLSTEYQNLVETAEKPNRVITSYERRKAQIS